MDCNKRNSICRYGYTLNAGRSTFPVTISLHLFQLHCRYCILLTIIIITTPFFVDLIFLFLFFVTTNRFVIFFFSFSQLCLNKIILKLKYQPCAQNPMLPPIQVNEFGFFFFLKFHFSNNFLKVNGTAFEIFINQNS